MPETILPSGIIIEQAALERGGRYRNVSDSQGGVLSSGSLGLTGGHSVYSSSGISNTTSDFLGDWRSVDSWQRFDLWLVRNRSRQLERGNDMCKAFKRNLLENVLGHKGFHQKYLTVTGKVYGDTTDGLPDAYANGLIRAGIEKQHRKENLTTRKQLSGCALDRLLLSRMVFDGEFILIKRKGFGNDCNFAWQPINADYLDHNLNRLEPNGNMIRMGVELDGTDKFPVAYWFLTKRPNETQYNYNETTQQRYIRVDAADVIHRFIQTEDEEQTRGWPWIFSAMINLFRSGRYQEAALVNATIGASKGMFYKKMYPQGFAEAGDVQAGMQALDKLDQGYLVDKVQPGMSTELPWGVEPVPVEYKYPDAQIGQFLKAMNLGISQALGTSYATTTGDLSEANFVSSRIGQLGERDYYMGIQEFFIEAWKEPQAEEELYRGMLSRTIPLPLSKIDKFNQFNFVGKRWPFVQPVDDMTAKVMAMDNLLTCPSDVIEEMTGESGAEMFAKIAKDNELLSSLGLARVHGTYQFVLSPKSNPDTQPGASVLQPPIAKPAATPIVETTK